MAPGVRTHRETDVLPWYWERTGQQVKPVSLLFVWQGTYMETIQATKEEEENSMHNTVVMFSTSDHFTLKQVGSPGTPNLPVCLYVPQFVVPSCPCVSLSAGHVRGVRQLWSGA